MLRVVLDVNVLISAVTAQSGVPRTILRAWREGQFELVVSTHLLAELADVLGRPHLARYVTNGEAQEFAATLRESAFVIEDPPAAERLVPRDPDDDYRVALARVGRAHMIVNRDANLLETDLQPPAYSPRDFLARLAEIEGLL